MDKQSRHDKTIVGRLRQRLAQILVRSSCATTSATTAFVGLSANTNASGHQEPATPVVESRPSNKPNDDDRCQRRPPHGRRSSLIHISIDCSARSVGAATVLPYSSPMPVTAKGGVNKQAAMMKNSRTSKKGKNNNNNNNKTRASSSYYSGWSSSSSTDDTELAATFSSDQYDDGDRRQGGEADTTTLFSSRSFSSDSTSDFYSTKNRRRPRRAPPPVRSDGTFRPSMSSAADRKCKNGTSKRKNAKNGGGAAVVVKRSHDPYADFRSSMVEMVAGRRICSTHELTELLVWYLSLNSPRHHPVILSAFHDVWEAVLSS